MADKTDSQRLVDIEATLKSAKKDSRISLEDIAAVWGVTKPRFVNKRKEMGAFPDPVEKVGNAYLYDTRAAMKALKGYIERHQKETKGRATRLGELIGHEHMAAHMAGGGFSIAELAKANQLATELEARQRDQGLYASVTDIQRTVGMVFGEISEFVSNLSNLVDPHGRLPPDIRVLIDTNGHKELLRMHAKLKAMLTADAVDRGTRTPDASPSPARARRKRS